MLTGRLGALAPRSALQQPSGQCCYLGPSPIIDGLEKRWLEDALAWDKAGRGGLGVTGLAAGGFLLAEVRRDPRRCVFVSCFDEC